MNVSKKQLLLCFLLLSTFFASSQIYSWAKTINGTDPDCRLYASDTDREGNTYVTGVLRDTLDFDPASGASLLYGFGKPTIFLAKYSSSGSLVWAQSFGSAYNDNGGGIGYSVKLDTFGNIYIAGLFKGGVDFISTVAELTLSHSGNFNNIFLAKYTTSGDFIWATNVASMNASGAGLIKDIKVSIDNQGYPIVASVFTGTINLKNDQNTQVASQTNGHSILLQRYTSWGPNYMWTRSLESTSEIAVKDVQFDTSGTMYIAGDFKGSVNFDRGASDVTYTSTSSSHDFFVAKYNPNGSYSWAHAFGGYGTDEVCALGLDASNNIYITGSVNGSVDMDPDTATALVNTGLIGSYLAKFDNSGNYLWAKSIGGPGGTSIARSLKLDNPGNVLIAGFFSNTVDFDPGSGIYNLSSQGSFDLYFAKYTAAGVFVGAGDVGGAGATPDMYQSSTHLSLDAAANIYLTGAFKGTLDFDPGAGTEYLSSTTNADHTIFLARYSGALLVTGLPARDKPVLDYNFYPNPFSQHSFLSLALEQASFTRISVLNISGTLVQTLENTKLAPGNHVYEVKLMEAGIYFLRIEINGRIETKKIIVLN